MNAELFLCQSYMPIVRASYMPIAMHIFGRIRII